MMNQYLSGSLQKVLHTAPAGRLVQGLFGNTAPPLFPVRRIDLHNIAHGRASLSQFTHIAAGKICPRTKSQLLAVGPGACHKFRGNVHAPDTKLVYQQKKGQRGRPAAAAKVCRPPLVGRKTGEEACFLPMSALM